MTPPKGKGIARTLGLLGALASAACGSSSSAPSSPPPIQNTVTVTVDGGPVSGVNFQNILYTTITVCSPGSTSNCQTIGGIQVDTGSSGLRLLAPVVTLSLPQATAPDGKPLAECLQFASSATWGTVRTVDLHIGGEVANSIPVQIIGDPAVPTVPTACNPTGFPLIDTVESFNANGLLGIAHFIQDCGTACETPGPGNAGLYYECPTPSTCQVTALASGQQVSNPVASFTSPDKNGVLISLPAVSDTASTVTGTMAFGIATQSDNALGSANVLTLNANGTFVTQFQGKSLSDSFLDTGSSALYFPDTAIPLCHEFPAFSNFFCPTSPLSLSATMVGANGASATVPFVVGNADSLIVQPQAAISTLCATNPFTQSNLNPTEFDWGLPFFFGRNVFVSIDSGSTPGVSGPFIAF